MGRGKVSKLTKLLEQARQAEEERAQEPVAGQENTEDIELEEAFELGNAAAENVGGYYEDRNSWGEKLRDVAMENDDFLDTTDIDRGRENGQVEKKTAPEPEKEGGKEEEEELLAEGGRFLARMNRALDASEDELGKADNAAAGARIEGKPPKIPGRGFFRRLGRGIVTLLTGAAAAAVSVPVFLISGTASLIHRARNCIRWKNAIKRGATEYLDTDRVPGTEQDERFVPVEDKGDQTPVDSDIRKVPLIYEYPIPGRTDRKPTASYLVGADKDVSEDSSHSHSFLELEYSRFSPRRMKDQRYRLRVGFLPHGGLFVAQGGTVFSGGRMPGFLENEKKTNFSDRRNFETTNRQINKMLDFMRQYPREGFNLVTRNCTTFTADTLKEGGIETDILKKVSYSVPIFRAGSPLLAATASEVKMYGKGQMIDKMGQKDLDYQRFGSNMVTKEEMGFYNEGTAVFGASFTGYSPHSAARAIRSQKGGQIGGNNSNLSYQDAMEVGNNLIFKANDVVADRHDDPGKECRIIIADITTEFMAVMNYLINQTKNRDSLIEHEADVSRNQDALRDNLQKLSDWYYLFGNGDLDLYKTISDLNSLLNSQMDKLDRAYATDVQTYKGIGEDRDIALTAKSYDDKKGYRFFDKGTGTKGRHDYFMTPRTVGGALRAGISPEEFGKFYSEFIGAESVMRKYEEARNFDEKNAPREYQDARKKYQSMKRTAGLYDEFARANDSVMEKEKLTKYDAEFVFRLLPEKEEAMKETGIGATMEALNNSPSRMLQASVFERIFSGLSSRLDTFADRESGTVDDLFALLFDYLGEKVVGADSSDEAPLTLILNVLDAGRENERDTEDTVQDFSKALNSNYIDPLIMDKAGKGTFDKIGEMNVNMLASGIDTLLCDRAREIGIMGEYRATSFTSRLSDKVYDLRMKKRRMASGPLT